ncbi:P-loop containing nucleoside triphosphate hydrolase protein [Leucosporidium creatinivorum]|uniref:p-loop containing nucleoside triphosphate hydrolase protein n=1 Tax=Leucosporidium creatinivorum TaxID=106004 RepID=A0A1Y2FKY8_9BASI|nr:P-loop containing nucleoside triphosphate hydrolase protein [Leucosporidium creatinivorum]
MLQLGSLALAALFCTATALPNIQQLSFGLPTPHSSSLSKHTPFAAFLEHFSSPASSTSIYLSHTLETLHPNRSFVVTTDPSFSLPAFAAEPSNGLKLHESKDGARMSKKIFLPAFRRRDGAGVVAERVIWGEWDVEWGGKEWKVITAEWPEGFQTIRQSHLIGAQETSISDSDLLLLAVSSYTSEIRESILVFDNSHWEADHGLWLSVQKASWSDVILDEELKSQLQREYKSFLSSESTYRELGVPWKRGIIFLGPPGNGKTISLKAIMKDSGVPTLYVKTFQTYAGDEEGIRMIFQRARAEAPCLLVLEDLDSLITEENRSFFLNQVDGIEDNDGLLLIATTNHFDKLDPALSNRPSRFDRKYTFPDPSRSERRSYALYWQHKLADNPKIDFPDSLLDSVAEKTKRFSFAYMKEAVVASLLILAGEEKGEELDFGTVLLGQIEWLRKQLGKEE